MFEEPGKCQLEKCFELVFPFLNTEDSFVARKYLHDFCYILLNILLKIVH